MHKLLKFFFITLGALITIILLSMVLLVTVVDPNQFKSEISQFSEQQWGQKVTINGDLSWTFFPWVGVKVKNLTLENPKGFTKDQPMADVQSADFKIRLLPLLQRHVEVGRINLNKLKLYLIKNASGKTNWDNMLAQTDDKKTEIAPSSPSAPQQVKALTIAGISVKDGSLSFDNQQQKTNITLTHFSLNTQTIRRVAPFTVNASFVIESNTIKRKLAVKSSTLVKLSKDNKMLSLNNLHLSVNIPSDTKNHSDLLIHAQANIAADLNNDSLKISDGLISSPSLSLKTVFNIEHFIKDPKATGTISIFSFNPKEFFSFLGDPITTTNPNYLTTFSLEANLEATPQSIKLNKMDLSLDDTTAQGNVVFTQTPKKQLQFNLTGDHIDLGGYAPTANKKTSATASQTTQKSAAPGATFAFPISGSLNFKRVTTSTTTLAPFKTNVSAQGNTLSVNNLHSGIYGGTLSGTAQMTLGGTPRLSTQLSLNQVRIESLGNSRKKATVRVRGRADAQANISMVGNTQTARLNSLAGRVSMIARNGVLDGVDINYHLQHAQGLIDKVTKPKKPDQKRTPFHVFSMSGNIQRGVMSTNDILLSSDTFSVKGNGWLNLPKQTLNIDLDAQSKTTQGRGWVLPITLSGAMASPKITPNYGKIIVRALKGEVTDQIKRTLGNDVGGAVGNVIDSLFR